MLDFKFSTLLNADTEDDEVSERLDSLIDFSILDGFALDFAEQLENLGDGNAATDSLDEAPTRITSDQIVWGDAENGIVLNGLELEQISSLDDLAVQLSEGLAEGAFSSIDVIVDSVEILSIEASTEKFAFSSGAQRIEIDGQFPTEFQDIFDVISALALVVSGESEDETYSDLPELDELQFSGLTVFDGDETIGTFSLFPTAVTLNVAGLSAELNGTFDFETVGEIISLVNTIVASGPELDLSDIPEFALTSFVMTGADGTELLNISGALETEDDFAIETATLLGTEDDDRNVLLDDIVILAAEDSFVDLDDGDDELEIEVDYSFPVDLFAGADPRDITLDGGDGEDELDFTSGIYGIYELDFVEGTFKATADPAALYETYSYDEQRFVSPSEFYDPSQARLFIDIDFQNFENADLDFYQGGELYVIGGEEDNLLDVQRLTDYMEIDGGAGTDRVKFDNLYAFFQTYEFANGVETFDYVVLDEPTYEAFSEFFTLEEDESDGSISMIFIETGEVLGRFENVEEFEFYLNEDDNEVLSTSDLFPDIVITGTDGDDSPLAGNLADNSIFGLAGDDVLFGDAGDDQLDGGAGADQFFGGLGDDVFLFDNRGDRATELVGDGFDTIVSSAEVTLGSAEVERVSLEGTANLRVNGNGFGTEINGNGGSNILIGGGGGDVITGGDGTDYFAFLVSDAEGTTRITDFGGNDQIALDDRYFNLGDGSIDVRGVTQVQFNNALRTETAIYDSRTGEMFIDIDGRGGPAEAELIAIIEGGGRLGLDDFLLF